MKKLLVVVFILAIVFVATVPEESYAWGRHGWGHRPHYRHGWGPGWGGVGAAAIGGLIVGSFLGAALPPPPPVYYVPPPPPPPVYYYYPPPPRVYRYPY